MKTKFSILFIIAILTIFVTAQTSKKVKTKSTMPAASDSARLPGQLTGEGDSIVIPSSARNGVEFEITIKTGGSGCSSKGDTNVVLGERSADIFVYDFTSATKPGMVCTMIFKQFDHKARLKFAKKGEVVIRIWVRDSGDAPMGKPVVIERTITVN